MKIKGTGIKTTRDFVKTNFSDRYDHWLNALSETSKQIYLSPVNLTEWFPMKEGYLEPVDKMIRLL